MIMDFWSWKPADLINVYKTRRQIFYKMLQKFFKIFWKLRFSWFFSSKYKRFSKYLFSLKVVVLWSRTKLLERCNLVRLLYSSSGLAISQKLKAKIASFYDFLVRPSQCTSKPFGVPYGAKPSTKTKIANFSKLVMFWLHNNSYFWMTLWIFLRSSNVI